MADSKNISPQTLAVMEHIRPLWENGLSLSEIGHRLGKTKNAIAGLMDRHAEKVGLVRRPTIRFDDVPTQLERLERIKPHYEAGVSYAEIGRLVGGISGDSVQGLIRRHGHNFGLVLREPRWWSEKPVEGSWRSERSKRGKRPSPEPRTGGAQEVVEARAAAAAYKKSQRKEIVAPLLTVVYTSPLPLPNLCQFPLWGDRERPKFRPDGSPVMCYAPSIGAYCEKHARDCYVRGRRAA